MKSYHCLEMIIGSMFKQCKEMANRKNARGAMKQNTWERFHSKMTSVIPLMSS
jgi:hypothetical protein